MPPRPLVPGAPNVKVTPCEREAIVRFLGMPGVPTFVVSTPDGPLVPLVLIASTEQE